MPRIKKNQRPRTERRRLERQAQKMARSLGLENLDQPMTTVCLAPGEQCPICAETGEQGGIVVVGDELMEWFHAIQEELKGQGHPTEMEDMDDEELASHWRRVLRISSRMDSPFSV